MSTKDCIAVVISASGLDRATFEQARLARELAEAKVAAAQDIVSDDRYRDALRLLITGMMVLFHQGGAPSIFEGKVMNVGRLIAGGYLEGMAPLNNANPAPHAGLLATTRRIFPTKHLEGFLWFSEVNHIPNPPLTKSILGRPPRAGENYIVVCPGDSRYEPLLRIWRGTRPQVI